MTGPTRQLAMLVSAGLLAACGPAEQDEAPATLMSAAETPEADEWAEFEPYYENCDAAREAGADPVYEDEPGYGEHLDRDLDGIGCEPWP